MEYELVTEHDRALDIILSFESKDAIAVDFEEECNLHMYGEHLSLIQVFDGMCFYVFDVLAPGIDRKILSAFFHTGVKKLWFDYGSDGAIVFKKYREKIENVHDIRSYAIAIGDMRGLDKIKEEYLGVRQECSKKKFQQLNWMRRPLDESAIRYALSDVEYLFDLEKVLWAKVVDMNVKKDATHRLLEARKVKRSVPGWMKIIDTKKLSLEERTYLRAFFNARDIVASRFNVPASWVLGKKELIALSLARPEGIDDAWKRVEKNVAPRFSAFFKSSLEKAYEKMK